MRRYFARNLLFVVGLNLLIKPIWIFAIDRNVQNQVGHASYGLYSALLNLAIVFQILLDFGLNSYTSRRISTNPADLPKLFPALLGTRLLLMSMYFGVVLSIGVALGYKAPELWLLAGTLLIQTLVIVLLFVRSNIAALQRFRLDGVLSVTDRGLMILVCAFLLWMPGLKEHFNINIFVLAQIGCYVLAVGIGFYLLYRLTKARLWPALRWELIKPIFKEGAPYALLTFLMALYMRSDSFLTERLVGETQAGIYAMSFRMLDVGNMIAIIIAGILLPLFGRMIAEKQSMEPIIKLSVNLLLPASVLVSITAWFFGEPIMALLYTNPAPQQGLIFAFVMSAFPAYCLMYVYGTCLTAAGHIRLLNILAASTAAFNLSLNFILIPKYGALGAAITAFTTQGMLAIAALLITPRKMNLSFTPKWIAAHLSYGIVLACLGLMMKAWDAFWILKLGLLAGCGALLMFLFQFLNWKEIKTVIRR